MVRPADLRKRKYEGKVDPDTLAIQTRALKPLMVRGETLYFPAITTVEERVKRLVEAEGTPTLQVRDYLNFGREMYELTRKFSGSTLAGEAQLRVNKWSGRGLVGSLLVKIAQLFGVTPSTPLEVLCLLIDGSRAMIGTLRLEGIINDALRVGSPTLAGRDIRVYGDESGGQVLVFHPQTAEFILINKSTDPDSWDKAMVWLSADSYASYFYMQSPLAASKFVWSIADEEASLYMNTMPETGERWELVWLTRFDNAYITLSNITTGNTLGIYGKEGISLGWDHYIRVGFTSSLPTPGVGYRGKMVSVMGDVGHADKLYMCMKKADESYEWVEVATG